MAADGIRSWCIPLVFIHSSQRPNAQTAKPQRGATATSNVRRMTPRSWTWGARGDSPVRGGFAGYAVQNGYRPFGLKDSRSTNVVFAHCARAAAATWGRQTLRAACLVRRASGAIWANDTTQNLVTTKTRIGLDALGACKQHGRLSWGGRESPLRHLAPASKLNFEGAGE